MYSIRTFTAQDVAFGQQALYWLNRFHHQAQPDYFKAPEQIEQHKDLSQYLDNERCFGFVASFNQQPVGLALGHVAELNSPISKAITMGSIDELYVIPEHRQQGLGKQLVEALAQRSKALGASDLFVEVWGFNQVALSFYQDLGLKPHVHWCRKAL